MPAMYEKHKIKWGECTRCELCHSRTKTVLLKGKIPASVLFIGEAPGPSEDVIGLPFVGPAGKLLDELIQRAYDKTDTYHPPPRMAFTNLVACYPKSQEEGKSYVEPSKESIKKCRPRLEEVIDLVKPKIIICVGKLAVKYLPESWEGRTKEIIHPSAILINTDTARFNRELMIKRTIVTLSEAFASL